MRRVRNKVTYCLNYHNGHATLINPAGSDDQLTIDMVTSINERASMNTTSVVNVFSCYGCKKCFQFRDKEDVRACW